MKSRGWLVFLLSVLASGLLVWDLSLPAAGQSGAARGSVADVPLSEKRTGQRPGASSARRITPRGDAGGCAIIGTVGLGSPDYPFTTGTQEGRIFRDGNPSTCGAAKACPGPFSSGQRKFDAYAFANPTGATACVTVNISTTCESGVGVFATAYLGSYIPGDFCTNYLADIGRSPTSTQSESMAFDLPAGQVAVVVVSEVDAGVCAGPYALSVTGLPTCTPVPFDVCIQDDSRPGNALLFNSTTGTYLFCCGAQQLTGTGTILRKGATVTLQHFGPDRRITARADGNTFRAGASVQFPPGRLICALMDRDTRNNTCTCGVQDGVGGK